MTDRLTHILDQLSGDLAKIARALGDYRRHLEDADLHPDEISAIILRTEERFIGGLLDRGREDAMDALDP